MGKFTQSVRRIVQDVKDEGTMSGLGREEVIEINERLILFRFRLEMSYETAKQALNSLMAQYSDSKSQRNIFHRYPLLKIMIKVCETRFEPLYGTRLISFDFIVYCLLSFIVHVDSPIIFRK